MYVAFLFGAKLTVLEATNGVARVKIQAEVFFCSVGGLLFRFSFFFKSGLIIPCHDVLKILDRETMSVASRL